MPQKHGALFGKFTGEPGIYICKTCNKDVGNRKQAREHYKKVHMGLR